jgi:hypothetical protein
MLSKRYSQQAILVGPDSICSREPCSGNDSLDENGRRRFRNKSRDLARLGLWIVWGVPMKVHACPNRRQWSTGHRLRRSTGVS